MPILKNILLKLNIKIIEIILPSGEKNKDLKVANKILNRLLKEKFERQDTIIVAQMQIVQEVLAQNNPQIWLDIKQKMQEKLQ